MFEPVFHNNILSSLKLNNQEMILPWGVETADSWSFFSLENNFGYRYKTLSHSSKQSNQSLSGEKIVQMKEGKWRLTWDFDVDCTNNKVVCSANLVALEDTLLMDFVLRFRFLKANFSHACIDGHKILHQNKNIYHQYPTKNVKLKNETRYADIKTLDVHTTKQLRNVMYVRDAPNEWVVHARMLPISSEKNVIKLCSRWFKTMPLPNFITNTILKHKRIKNFLWYHNELKPYQTKLGKLFNPNAYPLAKIKKGQQLHWKVEVVFNEQ